MTPQNDSPQTIKNRLIANLKLKAATSEIISVERTNLNTIPGNELLPIFEALPQKLTALILRENGLNNKASEELARAFALLPENLKVLNLSANWLGDKTGPELAQVFKALPKKLVLLHLNHNDLGNMATAELIEACKALPVIKALFLGFNNLHNKSGSELAQIFRALPVGLNTLNLDSNGIGDKPVEELIELFQALPRGLTSLNLAMNGLGTKSLDELSKIFKALPKNLSEIHLGGNGFESKTSEELKQLYRTLPPSVRKIHFNGSQLGSKPASELVNLCDSFLGRDFRLVNLSSNDLGLHATIELAKAFRKIPDTVTSLDLTDNSLNAKDAKELEQVFRVLPSSITTVNLSRNDFNKLNVIERDLIFRAFPVSVSQLIIDKQIINLIEYRNQPERTQPLSVSEPSNAHEAFQLKRQIKTDRENFLKRFEPQLLSIKEKMEELQDNGHDAAYKAAQRLCDNFIILNGLYEKGAIPEVIFKEDAVKAIGIARVELEKHRGWKATLGHLALCILGLGLGYLAYYAYKGHFFKFSTDSGMALDNLESGLESTEVVSPASIPS